MTSVPSHVTPLRLTQPASVDLARALPLFGDEGLAWLGTAVSSTRPGYHRYLIDLSLPIREHAPSLVFKKAAFVDLGEVQRTADGCEIEIGWRSSSMAPLFPVFAGLLRLTSTGLSLEGFYAPPGGEFGAVLDKAFLSIAARGTARWFLERTAEMVTGAQAAADLRAPNPHAGDGTPT